MGSLIQILEVVNCPSGGSNNSASSGEHSAGQGTLHPWPSDLHCYEHSQALALGQTWRVEATENTDNPDVRSGSVQFQVQCWAQGRRDAHIGLGAHSTYGEVEGPVPSASLQTRVGPVWVSISRKLGD